MARARYLQRNPNHPVGFCRWCGSEVTPPRRYFCDDTCVWEYNIRRSPSGLRYAVFERDKGVCAACGLDTQALRQELWAMTSYDDQVRKLEELGFTKTRSLADTLWEADHRVPVFQGGGACGLENIQTLCVPCHRKKTVWERQRSPKNR